MTTKFQNEDSGDGLAILILAQAGFDTGWLQSELRGQGIAARCHAGGSVEPVAASGHGDCDAILIATDRPGPDLIEGLAGRPDVPAILFCETMDPALGAELLRRGVSDIVLKSECYRLGPSLRRCLDALAGRRRLEAELASQKAHLEQLVASRTAELRQREHDIRTILDHMPAMIGYWDKNLRNRFANKNYRTWFGVEPEWMAGRHIVEVLGERLYALNLPYIEAVLRGEAQSFERAIPIPEGGVRHSQAYYIPDIQDGEVRGFYVLVSDISAIKKAESDLRGSEQRLRAIFDILPVGIALTDSRGRIVDCNPSALRLLDLSREEYLARDLACGKWCFRHADGSVLAPENYVSARALREGRPVHDVEVEYIAEGVQRWLSVSAMPVELDEYGVIVAFVDITEQRRLEEDRREMRRQIEKLAQTQVTFQVLAGLAHTFNQPLSAIGFYLESALRLAKTGRPDPETLDRVLFGAVQEVKRAGDILRELLRHFYKPRTDTEIVDLNQLIAAGMRKYLSGIGNAYPVKLESSQNPIPVKVNEQQMELIMENLLRNSGEAMLGAGVGLDQGRISVTVANLADMACVCVRDNGPGIPAALERRIFDPFFSTKDECTGMGLAISRTLVEAQGGRLWFEPVAGGAKFNFTVPLTK